MSTTCLLAPLSHDSHLFVRNFLPDRCLQVQLQVINSIINIVSPHFNLVTKHQSGWTLILPLSCYDNTVVNNVCPAYAASLPHTVTLDSHNNPMRPMGQGCPSWWRVNIPSAAALAFLNCHCFRGQQHGEGSLLKTGIHRNTVLWVNVGVAWGN